MGGALGRDKAHAQSQRFSIREISTADGVASQNDAGRALAALRRRVVRHWLMWGRGAGFSGSGGPSLIH